MSEGILLTGGTGKTGSRIARQLRVRNIQPRVASRFTAPGTTRFDWSDPSTFAEAVVGIESVYLVAPPAPDPLAAMQPFLEHALSAGVSRFVLLSASALQEGGPILGQVHQFLSQNAPSWIVLRPTWFMQNFSESHHRDTIVHEGRIYSATRDGRVPFIDAEDIAAVAVRALLEESLSNGDLILTGPSLLTYEEVAATIAEVVDYPVSHVQLSEEALAERLIEAGIPAPYSSFLASLDGQIADGAEARITEAVLEISGNPPRSLRDFALIARDCWSK